MKRSNVQVPNALRKIMFTLFYVALLLLCMTGIEAKVKEGRRQKDKAARTEVILTMIRSSI